MAGCYITSDTGHGRRYEFLYKGPDSQDRSTIFPRLSNLQGTSICTLEDIIDYEDEAYDSPTDTMSFSATSSPPASVVLNNDLPPPS